MSDKLIVEGLRVLAEQTRRPLRPSSTINKGLVKNIFGHKSAIAQNVLPNYTPSKPTTPDPRLQYTMDTNTPKNSLGVNRPIAPTVNAAEFMRANRIKQQIDLDQLETKNYLKKLFNPEYDPTSKITRKPTTNDLRNINSKQRSKYAAYLSNNPGVTSGGTLEKNIGPFSGKNINPYVIPDISRMPYDSSISKDITDRNFRVNKKASI